MYILKFLHNKGLLDVDGNEKINYDSGLTDRCDYHWWYQIATGQWAIKQVCCSSNLVSRT